MRAEEEIIIEYKRIWKDRQDISKLMISDSAMRIVLDLTNQLVAIEWCLNKTQEEILK